MSRGQGIDEAGRGDARAGLIRYGWSEEWEKAFEPYAEQGWVPGRVAIGYGIAMQVQVEQGQVWAIVTGRARHRARSPEDVPVVGDWVALRLLKEPMVVDADSAEDDEKGVEREAAAPRRYEAEAVVEKILPRRSRLARKAPGSPLVQQVLVANVDYAWLLSALGADFNPRRIERYLALAREGDSQPVIILNKADLLTPAKIRRSAESAAQLAGADVPVHVISSVTGQGMEELHQYLSSGRTVVLLGSSGVGKSTVINRLRGNELLDTQEVGAYGKGRHTTTRRELVPMAQGGLVIDTPGIRELQVWEGERGVVEAFPDIEELGLKCRFTNCAHGTEPGCAVTGAVADGSMSEDRLEAWYKLRAEARVQEAQREERERLMESRRGRGTSKGPRSRRG